MNGARGTGKVHVISGFCHEVDEICATLGYYAACSGSSLLTFLGNLLFPSSGVLTPEDVTNSLSQNMGKELSLYVVC